MPALTSQTEMAKEGFNVWSKNAVESWMYQNRVTPCDLEEEFHLVNKKIIFVYKGKRIIYVLNKKCFYNWKYIVRRIIV
jgi:hypothetical protein